MRVGSVYQRKPSKDLLSLSDSWRVLMAIGDKKPYYYKEELMQITNVTYSHLSTIIKNLEAKGLIKTIKPKKIREIRKTELGCQIWQKVFDMNSMLKFDII